MERPTGLASFVAVVGKREYVPWTPLPPDAEKRRVLLEVHDEVGIAVVDLPLSLVIGMRRSRM